MSGVQVSQGCLLVASPQLLDPNFVRTVVLVISHDSEGSFGLVLNRPLDHVLGDVLPDVSEVASQVPVLQGGPVQTDALQFMSRHEHIGRSVMAGISVGAALDDLLTASPQADGIQAYLGYSGWGEGQLESETAEGSWIVAPARVEHVFDVPAERLWATVLRELGGRYAWMAFEDGSLGDN
ncbi:MAG: YqgE/AlgH family protein [Planctomycetota bacterium]|jgi:putative transcriptional regulator